MGAPRLVRRLWDRLWNRRYLGHIAITFYPPGGEGSLAVSPVLAALSRRYWHWLYLQHLAESLAAIDETQERVRLLVAVRALAEDFVSRSYWPHVIGEKVVDAGAGAASIVPERTGGVAVTAPVMLRGGEMPTMRLTWFPPEARDRIASSNLVLLVHLMRGATHPLEQYEIFKKVALFVDYCERAGCPRGRAALRADVLHAVVHADLTEIVSPAGGLTPYRDAASDALSADPGRSPAPAAARPPRDRLTAVRPVLVSVRAGVASLRTGIASVRGRLSSPDPLWKQSTAAIVVAAVLWGGLVAGAFFLPRFGGPLPTPRPIASAPSAVPPQVPPAPPVREEVRPRAYVPPPNSAARPPAGALMQPVTKRRSAGAEAPPQPKPSPASEAGDAPKFRVVSGMLALDVAEHRSRVLAEQGVDSFVRERAGKLGRLQYGAYHFRETAEEDAKRFRAQGYTAVVIPW